MKTLYEVDPNAWMIVKHHRYGHIMKQLLLAVPYNVGILMAPSIHYEFKKFITKEIGTYEDIPIIFVDVSHVAYIGAMSRFENRHSR